jgi:hypothetical protein
MRTHQHALGIFRHVFQMFLGGLLDAGHSGLARHRTARDTHINADCKHAQNHTYRTQHKQHKQAHARAPLSDHVSWRVSVGKRRGALVGREKFCVDEILSHQTSNNNRSPRHTPTHYVPHHTRARHSIRREIRTCATCLATSRSSVSNARANQSTISRPDDVRTKLVVGLMRLHSTDYTYERTHGARCESSARAYTECVVTHN